MLLYLEDLPWDGASQAKVTNLDLAGLVDQEVNRLQVSVDYVGRVQEFNSTSQVVEDGEHVVCVEVRGLLDDVFQSVVTEVCDEEDLVESLQIRLTLARDDYIMQFYRKYVVLYFGQLMQNSYFSKHKLSQVHVVKDPINALDGVDLTRLVVLNFGHFAKAALADDLEDLILV